MLAPGMPEAVVPFIMPAPKDEPGPIIEPMEPDIHESMS